MTSVWIDEPKEVELKELLKPVIDYHSSVYLEFHKTDEIMDKVKIVRSYETEIKNKGQEITLHQKMSVVIPCKFTSYTKEKPTSAWLSDAKTFLYMLRIIKPGQYLKMDFWPSNDCDMFREKGLQQETILFSIIDQKKQIEVFSYTFHQIHDVKYTGISHVFRYCQNKPLSQVVQTEEKTESKCTA